MHIHSNTWEVCHEVIRLIFVTIFIIFFFSSSFFFLKSIKHHNFNTRLVEPEKKQQVILCFKNELKVLTQLEHPNIVNLFGYCISAEELILVMDLCDSNLKNFLREANYKPLTILQVIHFSIDILKGLSYLHNQKIGHRDLKPENILVKLHGFSKVESLQIADFGISRLFDDEETMLATTNMIGTPTYMSPEVTKEISYDALKSDSKFP